MKSTGTSLCLLATAIRDDVMPFLEALDALPADDPARTELFYQWLRRDWRALFGELRANRPVLTLPPFTVLARWSDVVDTLSRNETFRVPYAPHMNDSVGPFMLARDGAVENWRDKSVMRALLRWEDLPAIRALATVTAAEALGAVPPPTVDVVQTVSRLVPLRVVQQSFGFPGPDDGHMLRWSWATQADMFHNPTNDRSLLDACNAAGAEMRTWIRAFLVEREPWRDAQGEDSVSRLLRMTAGGLSGLDTEQVVSNVCGLLVGAIETTSQAIVNATEQILLRHDITVRAIEAARSPDSAAFDAIVWEALRFNPMTTFVARVAAERAVLAPGSAHETTVSAGSVIAVGIGSAMFDAGAFPEPNEFRVRRRTSYLHTGFGPHECLGQFVAYAIIPETIRQILLLPGIRLIESDAGHIDMAGGPFAEHFVIGHGAGAQETRG
jgi:cytochrome P450